MSDDVERACIRDANGCASAEELRAMDRHIHKPHLYLVHDERNAVDVTTRVIRRFLAMADDEPTELTWFIRGRVQIVHALTVDDHINFLRQAERIPNYRGAYMLANPINPEILARYPSNRIIQYPEGRASDNDMTARRAVYMDIDTKRPKGISSTNEQFRAAAEVADGVQSFLTESLGSPLPIGRGSSGNGFFLLVAIEPRPIDKDDTRRISKLLGLLHKKFGTDAVKIDASVVNPARLMPAPGTMKCKGQDIPERPHRRTSFTCRGTVERVPLEALA